MPPNVLSQNLAKPRLSHNTTNTPKVTANTDVIICLFFVRGGRKKKTKEESKNGTRDVAQSGLLQKNGRVEKEDEKGGEQEE
ncbi:hypothetical protein QOT17_002868 [Balamuthia mandrillaris]